MSPPASSGRNGLRVTWKCVPWISFTLPARRPYIPRQHLTRRHLMKRFVCSLAAVTLLLIPTAPAPAPPPPDDGKLRIICFGAHPDDCELQVGGVAAMWAAKGHHVKL